MSRLASRLLHNADPVVARSVSLLPAVGEVGGMSVPLEWGCPKCRTLKSRVIDTAHDDEGYIIRNRRCLGCGTKWATEEVPIRVNFWTRSWSRWQAQREYKQRERRERRAANADQRAEKERIRQREYKRQRYHSDPVYRAKVIARVKDYAERQKADSP